MEEGGEKIEDGQNVSAVAVKVEKKETELSPEVLETEIEKEGETERPEKGAKVEMARLQKEREWVSEKYAKRLEENKKFMEELKQLLGRNVDLGNAVYEEEIFKKRLEEIDEGLVELREAEKTSEVEAESGIEGGQEQDQHREVEKNKEAIEMSSKIEETETQEKKVEAKLSNPKDLEKLWEQIFSNPECMARISAAIKDIFGKKEKWEALKNKTVSEIESNSIGRKKIIQKIEAFRDEHRGKLGSEADPDGSESVKEWISRIVGLSMLSETEKKEAA